MQCNANELTSRHLKKAAQLVRHGPYSRIPGFVFIVPVYMVPKTLDSIPETIVVENPGHEGCRPFIRRQQLAEVFIWHAAKYRSNNRQDIVWRNLLECIFFVFIIAVYSGCSA